MNLSARQLQHARLVDDVRAALDASGLEASFLELEIKESSAFENAELTLSILRELAALGVRIAIDDFGTVHAPLRHLKRMPVQSVKIDASFAREIAVDPDESAIFSALTSMAHGLGLRVVAKSIESADQLPVLSAQGCDAVQGHCFSAASGQGLRSLARAGSDRTA